nr:MAG TPA: hypothetical protein [Caudoviricetes sp.]
MVVLQLKQILHCLRPWLRRRTTVKLMSNVKMLLA